MTQVQEDEETRPEALEPLDKDTDEAQEDGASHASPSARRKRVHTSLPGRYRALKRRLRRVRMALALSLSLCLALGLTLVAVSLWSLDRVTELEVTLAVTQAELMKSEAGRSERRARPMIVKPVAGSLAKSGSAD